MPGYYHQEDLARFAEIGKDAPELWKKFSDWYGAVFAEGALTEREKALIALAVAHAVQCPYCIVAYTQACLEKGSNLEQMSEALAAHRRHFGVLGVVISQSHWSSPNLGDHGAAGGGDVEGSGVAT
jgi:4-carboxymuconolactone decarboxylase